MGSTERRDGNDGLIEIEGEVVRVRSTRGDWSLGTLKSADAGSFTYVGKIVAEVGDRVKLRGKWVTHPRWGDQFDVKEFIPKRDVSPDGIAKWLEKCPAFKGIGASRARFLAQYFGNEFETALRDKPEQMSEVAGIPLAVIENLQIEWAKDAEMHRGIADLIAIGVPAGKAKIIYARYGASGVGIIKNDPFWLIRRVEGFAFKTVDIIARNAGMAKSHPSRIREGVLFTVDELTEGSGSTWARGDVIVEQADKLLALDSIGPREIILAALRDACEGFIDPLELPHGDPQNRCGGSRHLIAIASSQEKFESGQFAVFPRNLARAEAFVSNWIALATSRAPHHGLNVTVDDVRREYSDSTLEQAGAVASALSNRISIITGGAGTGKTYTVSMLRELAQRADLHVTLCAPTGKAARRLQESVGMAARTIHSLLRPCAIGGDDDDRGGKRWGFAHPDVDGFLEVDILVVDEVSMVDISLLYALLRACGPATSIVLIGDPNQLPPVGPGSFLRDAIDRRVLPIVALTTVHRNAGYLKEATVAILEGRVMPGAPAGTGERPVLAPWYIADKQTAPTQVMALVENLFAHRLREHDLEIPIPGSNPPAFERRPVDVWNDAQVLVPMKKYECGLDEMNKRLQRLYQSERGVDVSEEMAGKPMVGDKIVYTRNRTDLGLLNGTTGRVISIDRETGDVTISVDGEADLLVRVPSEDKRDMLLAYAMTVHRAQGSEYPVVVFVCVNQHKRMLFRALGYTAVSRARRTCIVVGDRWGIGECARNQIKDDRQTLGTLCKSSWCTLPKHVPPTPPGSPEPKPPT